MKGRSGDRCKGNGLRSSLVGPEVINAAVEVNSSVDGDTNLVTVFGTDKTTGDAVSDTVQLTGTVPVTTTVEFKRVYGFEIQQPTLYPSAPGTTDGTVSVRFATELLMEAGPSTGAGIRVPGGYGGQSTDIDCVESRWYSAPASFSPNGAPILVRYELNADVPVLCKLSEVSLVCLSAFRTSYLYD